MLRFRSYLTESIDKESKLTHLEHAEDFVFHGPEEYSHAHNALVGVHNKLLGDHQPHTKVTTKMDGSSTVVWGHHPTTGKFFVGTKSVFSKGDPKLNHTHDDIQRHHGHIPDLANRLSAALEHLPKVSPKKGVFQGDIMYTHHDVKDHGDKVSITPNTLTYSAQKHSPMGKKISTSKFGVAAHTAYDDNMNAVHGADIKMNDHPDVHVMSVHQNGGKHSEGNKELFKHHLEQANSHMDQVSPETHSIVSQNQNHIKTYVNKTVRTGEQPSVEGLKSHIGSVLKKPDAKIADINQHQTGLQHLFKAHAHIQSAKHALINSLADSSEFEHSINGTPSKPEGFVVTHHGRPLKLVNRAEFTRANFAKAH